MSPIMIDEKQLEMCCMSTIDDFMQMASGTYTKEIGGSKAYPYIYLHVPGSKILGVAHLDIVATVKPEFAFEEMQGKKDGKKYYWTPCADDRAGVYALLYHLAKMGMRYDILLTTGEEVGQSSAKAFKTSAKYNWIFELDRRETDVVMYSYERSKLGKDDFFDKLLNLFSLKLGMGSFSDIEGLQALGVIGFNFGIGYHNEHTQDCYIDPEEFLSQVAKFGKFYDAFKNVKLPFEAAPITHAYGRSWEHPTPKGRTVVVWTPPVNGAGKTTTTIGAINWRVWKRRAWYCNCTTANMQEARRKRCKLCGMSKKEYVEKIEGVTVPVEREGELLQEVDFAHGNDLDLVRFRELIREAGGLAVTGRAYLDEVIPALEEFTSTLPPSALTARLSAKLEVWKELTVIPMQIEDILKILLDTGGMEFVNGALHSEGGMLMTGFVRTINFINNTDAKWLHSLRLILAFLRIDELQDLHRLFTALHSSGKAIKCKEINNLAEIILLGEDWLDTTLWLESEPKQTIPLDSTPPVSGSPALEVTKSVPPSSPTVASLPSTPPA
jgi:hypothetical protein